jgi:hypothetical protein
MGCGMSRKQAHPTKNPLPVIQLRRGCQHTRRLETHPHGALRSREAYPSQSSSQKGCCHTDRPAGSSGPSDPPPLNIVSPPPLLSRGETRSYGSARAASGSTSFPSSLGSLQPLSDLFGLLEIFIRGAPEEQAPENSPDGNRNS